MVRRHLGPRYVWGIKEVAIQSGREIWLDDAAATTTRQVLTPGSMEERMQVLISRRVIDHMRRGVTACLRH